jgi:hypothetical protein
MGPVAAQRAIGHCESDDLGHGPGSAAARAVTDPANAAALASAHFPADVAARAAPTASPAVPAPAKPGFEPRADEVTRAVRWQRLAPAFAVGAAATAVSDRVLVDRWRFAKGDSWATWLEGQELPQGAPAVSARGPSRWWTPRSRSASSASTAR